MSVQWTHYTRVVTGWLKLTQQSVVGSGTGVTQQYSAGSVDAMQTHNLIHNQLWKKLLDTMFWTSVHTLTNGLATCGDAVVSAYMYLEQMLRASLLR